MDVILIDSFKVGRDALLLWVLRRKKYSNQVSHAANDNCDLLASCIDVFGFSTRQNPANEMNFREKITFSTVFI